MSAICKNLLLMSTYKNTKNPTCNIFFPEIVIYFNLSCRFYLNKIAYKIYEAAEFRLSIPVPDNGHTCFAAWQWLQVYLALLLDCYKKLHRWTLFYKPRCLGKKSALLYYVIVIVQGESLRTCHVSSKLCNMIIVLQRRARRI